ncbi:MAG: serine--tRNA ligase [Fimbriimonadaceae bacterium]|nr:serine--tRNA ligase [Chitinophagales bacterium]
MLDINYLRNNIEVAKQRLAKRSKYEWSIVESVLSLDDDRKKLQTELDNTLAESNSLAKQIGQLFAQGKKEEADEVKNKTGELKNKSAEIQKLHDETVEAIKNILLSLPNLPQLIVPDGQTPEENITVREGGKFPELNDALPHWELTTKYNLIDFELGNKITGSGFPVYINKGAKLQRSLIAYYLDKATEAGYIEYVPPFMVNEDSGFGTGQLPDKEGQMYHAVADNYFLIPTAEVPLTNIYRDVIVSEKDFPIKMTAYTPCFRREAGSYGKDVRGLNRLHQFDKVEIVQITHPENSDATLDEMVKHVEQLIISLELPYRILRLCGGDMGFASAITYDFEVYSAAQKRWLEVSSVSNFETFQANRLKCRYKDSKDGKNKLVHTLNGSALALPRIVAALLENNQSEDGIKVPKVVHRYTGFEKIM